MQHARLWRVAHGMPTAVLRKRFVPPWERDGKSADEFFTGLMTSGNPIQQQRKVEQRMRTREEAIISADPLTPEDQRRLEELSDHNKQVEQARRDFLPYGAKPKRYFEVDKMAAWGEFQAALQCHQTGTPSSLSGNKQTGYSEEIRAMLANDMKEKIPYRYTHYVPPPSSGQLTQWPLHGTTGLVIDVDGVVHRSYRPIPGVNTAIRMLQTLRVPFVFLSNSGRNSEAMKAKQLSDVIGCEIAPEQVLLAHSPMRLLAPRYRNGTVIVVGPPECSQIAREYGFKDAISILQFQKEHPELVPYKKWGPHDKIAEPGTVPFPPVSSVFQFSDPEDIFSDIQTMLDLFLAPRGQVGMHVSGVQTIPYYIGADDLLWATEAPLPRLGQGAIREMFASVFESVTGQSLQATIYGKPRAIAYAYAEKRLKEVSEALGWKAGNMRAIFMVGDNIETDIIGANGAQGLWTSVHVLTGINKAPAALRTLCEGDDEHEWIESCISKVPHYITPTLDHFVRELLAFPEHAVLQNKKPYHGKINPVDLKLTYNFTA